jgi:hypothetical protein
MLASLIPGIFGIVDKLIPDTAKASELKAQLEMELVKQAGKQIEVNKQEARHRSIFVAGWRPFIGWVCGLSFAYHFLIYPVLVLALSLNGQDPNVLPTFDMSSLLTVMMGMLGLGGLRTYEKKNGLTK